MTKFKEHLTRSVKRFVYVFIRTKPGKTFGFIQTLKRKKGGSLYRISVKVSSFMCRRRKNKVIHLLA